MTLSMQLAYFVPAKVRKRGKSYFQDGLVTVTVCEADRVEATVTGSEDYSVFLIRERQQVFASCSCLFFHDRGEICKHIWATVLAVDEGQGLRGPRGGVPTELLADLDDALGEDEEEDFEMGFEAADPLPRRPAPGPAIALWRAVMDDLSLAGSTAAVRQERQILYVVDVPVTIQRRQLTVDILTAARKADGSWGGFRALRITRSEAVTLADAADREILTVLAGAAQGGLWAYGNYMAMIPVPSEIPEGAAGVVLPLIARTGRCRLRQGGGLEGEPLAWDGGAPWELWLEVREEPKGDCTVTGSLRRGEERLDLDKPLILLRSGVLLTGSHVARLDAGSGFEWIPALRRAGGAMRVPAADREELLEKLLATPALPRLDLPPSMRVDEERPAPQPRIRLLPPPGRTGSGKAGKEWPEAEVSFLYGGHEVTAGAVVRGVYLQEERRFLVRDREAEMRAVERLGPLGFRLAAMTVTAPGERKLRVSPGRVPAAVRTLLAEGWSVEAQGKLYRSSGRFQLAVASGIDWFELHGTVDFEGQSVRLPELLAALRRGEGFLPLGDGSLGLVPEEWVKRLGPMAGLGQATEDHVRFQPAQAALLDAWLTGEPEVTCDEVFERARQRLRSFSGIAPAAAPPGFRGELRGYQKAGLGWLHFLRDFGFGGCLADDMGLGKTVQVLALLEARREQRTLETPERPAPSLAPSLAVVPRSLVFNWLAEAAQFTPELRILDYTGIGRPREGDPFAGCDLVLTTYGTLRRDVATLRQTEFDYVILDEAQAIKNADSQTARAARLLRGHHRLALSGTPVENHLGELWSLFEFLNPGFLGAAKSLRTQRSPAAALRDPDSATREMLGRALRPFLLRRTKEQVAPELPAKIEQTLSCELPPKQRKLYDELRDHYRGALSSRIGEQEGLGRVKILVLEALLRLRQAACHPALLDRGRVDEPCAKLEILLPQLREVLAEGHKALVFSQFTSFLALLRTELDREGLPYLYLDGRTRDRREKVEQFQSDPGFPLFLISLKAGGLGLNLTAADYVYLLDPWWNPAVEAQAIDRAHRIGQSRPVFAYRLVARDTVEEKILELQRSKRSLADAIIQADQSLIASLSREDLELLLS
jgi:superfamily II DNA or RNA helicase